MKSFCRHTIYAHYDDLFRHHNFWFGSLSTDGEKIGGKCSGWGCFQLPGTVGMAFREDRSNECDKTKLSCWSFLDEKSMQRHGANTQTQFKKCSVSGKSCDISTYPFSFIFKKKFTLSVPYNQASQIPVMRQGCSDVCLSFR